jgi:hypothetical protein
MLSVDGDTVIDVRVFAPESVVTKLPQPATPSTNATKTGKQSDWNRSRRKKEGRIDSLTKQRHVRGSGASALRSRYSFKVAQITVLAA